MSYFHTLKTLSHSSFDRANEERAHSLIFINNLDTKNEDNQEEEEEEEDHIV